ncbi:TetR/AcrR family transcriptional regulator [Asanoa iriomotensis]|uniref:TetR family transcriptional regulator n=1 Tax=Asanoa iriomotensis TaxID=234613 RepID=A0ABQ4CCS5_9ACTN|nr:TetR-like C-terminal domain-containing protein [Asanoa iriomotensis]GIF60557.1 TetR family transcriptional regulator [Asanoa iriomotensis]
MSRREQILDVALELLERDGVQALTMRAIGEAVGMRAPSLYKHVPDKQSLEAGLIARGLTAQAQVFARAKTLTALARAYRGWAREHPHLYRLMTDGPLPRDLLPPGVEDAAAAPLLAVTGSVAQARALWGLAHGLISLELAGRFPPGADVDAAWRVGIAAFTATTTKGRTP